MGNLLPKLKNATDKNLLKVLALTWNTCKTTIHKFLWIENVPKDGIEKIGLNEFKKKLVLQKEFKDRLTSVLKQVDEEHREGSSETN